MSGSSVNYVGAYPGSSGTVTVSGTGSAWNNTSAIFIGGTAGGPGGAGLLSIAAGGLVSATQTTIWQTGTLAFGANATLNSPLTVNGGVVSAFGGPLETGTLAIGGALTLNSGARFVFTLDSTGGGAGDGASELLAASANLNPASQFDFTDISLAPGSLTLGTAFIAVQTTGGITGAFGNLPNGSQFASGPNTYEATYTPDSLTLTVVVPEPATWGMLLAGLGTICLANFRSRRPPLRRTEPAFQSSRRWIL